MTDSTVKSSDGTSSTSPTVESELIPAEEKHTELFLDMSPLTHLQEGKQIRVPKNPHFTRKDVVNAFQQAFELTGGVPRLAIWANDNYTEFTKLYARLLPSQSNSALGEANVLRIEMAVRPGALDE